ncbi:hypothetical protein HN51_035096 [Arachis hypogaea]|uniref:Aquaporin n=1 Tax=Arachis hypogaea TaxID=3818 RepID=A0A445A5V8_ARAHY|nr:aquaporin SIP1-2 [Arachis ipaensis]XP_025643239.1 aquaporin SIP1-2 [Arachis hypogaea]QHO00070.1 Aquaporin [Arachis hypogaea]RYR21834.1 hypothetical protein Ahy_B03g067146 [Arachis hypogaea]
MGAIKSAMGDAILTSVWVFSLSSQRIISSEISSFLGFKPFTLPSLFLSTIINSIIVFTITSIGRFLGGASFNPSSTVSSYFLGLRPDSSLSSLAIRFPAQALGGALGAKGLLSVVPPQYKILLKGPYLKVDLHTGAFAEGALVFALNLAILIIVMKGPKNPFLKVYMISLTTLTLAICGSGYTGPSMNPANAFGWAYMYNRHMNWELFYVYWICPFIGAFFAALVYKALFMSPPEMMKKKKQKQKKA